MPAALFLSSGSWPTTTSMSRGLSWSWVWVIAPFACPGHSSGSGSIKASGKNRGGHLAFRTVLEVRCLSAQREERGGVWPGVPTKPVVPEQQGRTLGGPHLRPQVQPWARPLTSLSRLVAHSKESSGDLEIEDALVCMMGLKDHTLMTPSTSKLATLLPEQSTLR